MSSAADGAKESEIHQVDRFPNQCSNHLRAADTRRYCWAIRMPVEMHPHMVHRRAARDASKACSACG